MSSPDVSSIVPGSIFQDDTTPPTINDGTDPTLQQEPSYTASGGGGSGGSSHTEIEVNSTIQIVLISLGIVVGALFLLGVIATYYISHKNKRAQKKKDQSSQQLQLEDGGEGGATDLEKDVAELGVQEKGAQEGGGGGVKGKAAERGTPAGSSFSSQGQMAENGWTFDEERRSSASGSGVGYGLSRSSTPGFESTPSSASGPIATAATAGGGGHHKRNSFVEVAQVYAHRQSLVNPLGSVSLEFPDLQLAGMFAPGSTGLGSTAAALGGPFGHWGAGPSSTSSSTGSNTGALNPFASPPPSNGSNLSTTLLVDPFKSNNNSQASLNLLAQEGLQSSQPQNSGDALEEDVTSTSASQSMASGSVSSLPSLPPPPPPPPVDIEPKVVLRKNNRSMPLLSSAYRPMTVHSTNLPPLPLHSRGSSHNHTTPLLVSSDISYQPPSRPTSPVQATFEHRRPSRRSSNVYHQGGTNGEGSTTGLGTVSWHRKRASVVVPEGTVPVRLWKEDPAAVMADLQVNPLEGGLQNHGGQAQEQEQQPRVMRNGAAVFEGVHPSKESTAINSGGRGGGQRRKWAGGQISVDHQPFHGRKESEHGQLQEGGGGQDKEQVVVSLPSPRGCLLEAEAEQQESMDQVQQRYLHCRFSSLSHDFGDPYHQQQQQPYPLNHPYAPQQHQTRSMQSHHRQDSEDAPTPDHEDPLPKVVKRGGGGTKNKNSYLDDYRELQKNRHSVAVDGTTTATRSGSGKMGMSRFFSNLHGSSTSSSSSSQPPLPPLPLPAQE